MDQQLWYHIVGTPQEDDKFIFAQPEHPTWFIGAEVTDDGRWASMAIHGLTVMSVLLQAGISPEAVRGCLAESYLQIYVCKSLSKKRLELLHVGICCCL